jgi:Resolvase, N terminal domain
MAAAATCDDFYHPDEVVALAAHAALLAVDPPPIWALTDVQILDRDKGLRLKVIAVQGRIAETEQVRVVCVLGTAFTAVRDIDLRIATYNAMIGMKMAFESGGCKRRQPCDWRLERWGRSLPDQMTTLRELNGLGVGFVSLTEALDLTTPTGRAMAGMLAIFAEFEREILRERVRAGIAQARKEGRPHGRPPTASLKSDEVARLKGERLSHSELARRLGIGRTSVRRIHRTAG